MVRERAWGSVRHSVNQKAFGIERWLRACAKGIGVCVMAGAFPDFILIGQGEL